MKQRTINIVGNAIIFQGLWFAAVLGAAAGSNWPSLAALGLLFVWAMVFGGQIQADLRMAFIGLLIAFAVEPVWIGMGLIEYRMQPDLSYPPLWIVALWVGFALCFNHSLHWLKPMLPASVALGLCGSLLSITAASRLDAVAMPQSWWSMAVVYGPVWCILVPVLARLSGQRLSDENRNEAAQSESGPA